MIVQPITSKIARSLVEQHHYLHRKPPVSFAFGLLDGDRIAGVITFGTPPSRHLQVSAAPTAPEKVIELNRLWVEDAQPKNTESWFVSRALALLPPLIVVSYADTAHGHAGYIYRALNFFYAGYTDMERKTPRYDYVVAGKHSRDAFRCNQFTRVRRKPKYKYWTLTGTRRERRALAPLAAWPKLDWHQIYPTTA